MELRLGTIIYSALIAVAVLSPQAVAQQKTVKACQQEWRANKADNQAKGITEKSYVDQCRAGTASDQSATAPVPPSAAPASKAGPTAPAAAPATKPAPRGATAPAGANEFSTEAQAKSHCPSDNVVWANLNSKIYHYPGHRDYGTTKQGAYMCEKDTATAGFRAAKNEKQP